MFSTIPAVRVALVDLFTATLNLTDDPPVVYGAPAREVPEEYVVVGSVVDPVDRSIARLPHNTTSSMNEDYGLRVQCRVLARSRNDVDAQRDTFERNFALMARLDTELRKQQDGAGQQGWRLNGLVTWAYFGTLELAEGPLHEGWESVITATVVVKAARI